METIVYEMHNKPTAEEYIAALRSLQDRVSEAHLKMFRAHFYAPEMIASSKYIAEQANIKGGHPQVNLVYGKLGHALCDVLGIEPDFRPDDTARWWSVWSRGWRDGEVFYWQLLTQAAEAFVALGWVAEEAPEVPAAQTEPLFHIEGTPRQLVVTRFERSRLAKRQCIDHYGAHCAICHFDFGKVYGPYAQGHIHVHHLEPLAKLSQEYQVNPVRDLLPVCANCHSVIHLRGELRSPEEIREMMRQARDGEQGENT